MNEITVRPASVTEWAKLRDLRLEMLADTPVAYVETLLEAQDHPDDEWIARAQRSSDDNATSLVAEDALGRWVGGVVCFRDTDHPYRAWLVAVYVHPEFRGQGVADKLLDAAEAWARERVKAIHLHVAEVSDRARGFYARRNYVATGESEPNTHDSSIRDLELARFFRD